MKKSDIDLQKEWVQLSTPDLEAMLQSELEKKVPDDDKVLTLLHILEAREPDETPELTDREREAFEWYKQKVYGRKKKSFSSPRWLFLAASVALILGLFFAVVPQQAEAETFWEMLQRLSSSVIEFLGREDKFTKDEYIFKTDNPGLQQVYDAAVELGVTEPMVPMWLPEGSEIVSFKEKNAPMSTGISAIFSYDGAEIVYKLAIYEGEPAHQFYRDDDHYESYEKEGTTFNITRNNDRWSVIWTKNNIECHITLDCQEETLRRILKSIYVMEA